MTPKYHTNHACCLYHCFPAGKGDSKPYASSSPLATHHTHNASASPARPTRPAARTVTIKNTPTTARRPVHRTPPSTGESDAYSTIHSRVDSPPIHPFLRAKRRKKRRAPTRGKKKPSSKEKELFAIVKFCRVAEDGKRASMPPPLLLLLFSSLLGIAYPPREACALERAHADLAAQLISLKTERRWHHLHLVCVSVINRKSENVEELQGK